MFRRMPREWFERLAAMRSDSASETGRYDRILNLGALFIAVLIAREALDIWRIVMAEFVWPVLGWVKWFASFLAIVLIFSVTQPAHAATCTKGTDCYCDCVEGPVGSPAGYKNAACSTKFGVGVPVDTSLKACEDWEALTLHDNVGFGNGAPYYGPPYDHTGGVANFRGQNSYFQRKFPTPSGVCSWGLGQPAAPILGITCNAGSSCAAAPWTVTDIWQAPSTSCFAIFRDGEFGGEVGSLAAGPSNNSDGSNGVFDGRQNFAHRIGAGLGNNSGFSGSIPMTGGNTGTTFGVTWAQAYAANAASAGVWLAQWKHDEWLTNSVGALGTQENADMIQAHRGTSLSDTDPFQPLMIWASGFVLADCQTAVAGATIRAGSLQCETAAGVPYLYYLPNTSLALGSGGYRQSRDWPLGTWGCVQAHFQNLGTTRGTVTISFNGSAIIDFDIDPRPFAWKTGFNSLGILAFANANQTGTTVPTTQTTYRYWDNIHVRSTAPVSCAQVGFSAVAPSPTPTEPGGVRVTSMRGIFVTRFREIILVAAILGALYMRSKSHL